jgi:hypothetical protein
MKGKYARLKLTESSTLHFLCRDPKDRQYLDHNIDNHLRHPRSRCDADVYLKPVEEALDAVKDVDQLVSASARIFSHLGALGVK